MDYRRLNALTTKDAYPLPRIDDSLRLHGNQQWFSTMDLASGYWQVAMFPEAKQKAAFVMNEGLFQFRVIPFGLSERLGHGWFGNRCFVDFSDLGISAFFFNCYSGGCFLCLTSILCKYCLERWGQVSYSGWTFP